MEQASKAVWKRGDSTLLSVGGSLARSGSGRYSNGRPGGRGWDGRGRGSLVSVGSDRKGMTQTVVAAWLSTRPWVFCWNSGFGLRSLRKPQSSNKLQLQVTSDTLHEDELV